MKNGLFNKLFTIALLIGCFYLPKNSWAYDEASNQKSDKVAFPADYIKQKAEGFCQPSWVPINTDSCSWAQGLCRLAYIGCIRHRCELSESGNYLCPQGKNIFDKCEKGIIDETEVSGLILPTYYDTLKEVVDKYCNSYSECGDGVEHPDKECDDGDKVDGNGCSSACKIEAGYKCHRYQPSQPSVCEKIEMITLETFPIQPLPVPVEDNPVDKGAGVDNDEGKTDKAPTGSFLEGGCSLNPGSTKASVREYFLLTLFGLPLLGVYVQKRKILKS